MNEIFITFLSLSLSGSLLALALFLLKPLTKARVSRQWQYYIWLVVIARLLLPFSPVGSFAGEAYNAIGSVSHGAQMQSPQTDSVGPAMDLLPSDDGPIGPDDAVSEHMTTPVTESNPFYEAVTLFRENYWLIWLTVAVALLIRKITVYRGFVRYVRAGVQPVQDTELLDRVAEIGAEIHVRRAVELCVNPLVSSPLLLGFFRPCIVIPSTDISDRDFHNTILHELTHYKRRDMFFKWLVQVTICLHWFNPLVYIMGREVNKACEFSCDEAVVARLGADHAPEYGETLLESMAAVGYYKEALASVTLSENKKMLKERLVMIVNYRKKTALTVYVSVFITALLLCGFAFTGAYASKAKTKVQIPTPNPSAPLGAAENPRVEDMTDPDLKGTTVINLSNNGQKSITHSSSFNASANQVLTLEIKSNISGTVDLFLFSPASKDGKNDTLLYTFGGGNDTKTIKLSEGRWAYNCTGFFDSGNITIKGVITNAPLGTAENPKVQDMTDPDVKATKIAKAPLNEEISKPNLDLSINTANVQVLNAADNHISVSYDPAFYKVEVANTDGNLSVDIMNKLQNMSGAPDVTLYLPLIEYGNIKLNLELAVMSLRVAGGNITANANLSDVILELRKGYAGSVNYTSKAGTLYVYSSDKYVNGKVKITNDTDIMGDISVPDIFSKNGNVYTYNNGTQKNVIDVTLKEFGAVVFKMGTPSRYREQEPILEEPITGTDEVRPYVPKKK